MSNDESWLEEINSIGAGDGWTETPKQPKRPRAAPAPNTPFNAGFQGCLGVGCAIWIVIGGFFAVVAIVALF